MKEATGELSVTVITIVALAAIATLFAVVLLPIIRTGLKARTYCQQAVDCQPCKSKTGKTTCYYYEENADGSLKTTLKPIQCPCEQNK